MHRWDRLKDTSVSLKNLQTALTIISLAACASSSQPARRTPVEIWRGGDDGLTSRFADTLEIAFRGSSEFSLSSGKAPGSLIVVIPSNVTWKQAGGRKQMNYDIEFTNVSSLSLGSSHGSCDVERLQVCAARVLGDAKLARVKFEAAKARR